jgi:hypothetical protein
MVLKTLMNAEVDVLIRLLVVVSLLEPITATVLTIWKIARVIV